MTPQQRKIVIPIILIGAALSIALLYMAAPDRSSPRAESDESAQTEAGPGPDSGSGLDESTDDAATGDEAGEPGPGQPGEAQGPETDAQTPRDVSIRGLHAVAPHGRRPRFSRSAPSTGGSTISTSSSRLSARGSTASR